MRLVALAIAILVPTVGWSDFAVSFRDGAPKDTFTLMYDGACPIDRLDVQIDLGTAPTGLIFDITGSGAGVSVFQPLEWVSGSATISDVTDGDTTLSLILDSVKPGDSWAFTVDIDDSSSGRQTIVDGSEMAGATLRVGDQTASFDANGSAVLALDPCIS